MGSSARAGLDEGLEPRASPSVEARAAPASDATPASDAAPTADAAAPEQSPARVPAPVPAPAPAPATRAAQAQAQSQGVRPAGTVSVAHLHCGLGYYRDHNGRCRRSRRPSS